jgi:PKD repeat protein
MKATNIILSVFLFFGCGLHFVKGQTLSVTISGPPNPSPGTPVTYSANWNCSSSSSGSPTFVLHTWSFMFNGSAITPSVSSNGLSATISWPSIGTGSVSYTGVLNGSGFCGSSGFTSKSDFLSVSTMPPPPPAPVVSRATLDVSGSCFIANWQASSGATSYRLDVSGDKFSTFVNGIQDATVDGTSISIGGLTAGNYQYRVRAVNAVGGVSPYSQVFSFIVVCAGATSTPPSRFINYERFADYSNSICGSGTNIIPSIVAGDNTIVAPRTNPNVPNPRGYKYYEDFGTGQYEPNNSQPAIVAVNWNPYRTGYIRIRVDQERYLWGGFLDLDPCENQGPEFLYNYDIYLANCSSCQDSGGPLTSNIYQSSDYGCGTKFRLFANFGNKNCQPISYEWNFGDGTTYIDTEPLETETPHTYASSGPYTVTLRYKSRCNGSVVVTETTVSRPITVTSVLSSKLDFTFQNSTCGTTFTAVPIHPDNNCTNVAYEWDFGDNTPKSTLASPSHLYSRAGSYNVSLKLTYSCSGCQKFITYNKTVTAPEQPPIASFTQQNNSCTTTFRPVFSLTGPSCTKTYTWNFGDGATYIDTEPLDTQTSHTYASAGIYSTSLTVDYSQCGTGTNNCSGQVIITKPTIIVAPEAPTVDFTTQNYSCEMNFTPSIIHKNTACSTVSYLWNFGDGTTSAESNPAHLYASAGTYSASLTLTYQCLNTCPAQASVTISKTIILSAPPTATADFTFRNYYCATKFSTTTNYSSNTCRSVSYLWNFGDGATSADRNPIHAYTNPGSYNVLLKVSYQCNNGCPAEISVSKQITYTSLPAQLEDMLIQVETDVKKQVIAASAVTFSDVWPLSHDNAALGNRSSYLNGTHGVWRNNATYAYDVQRELSATTNLKKDGTFTLNQFDWGSANFNVVPDWINANSMTQYSPYSYELENQDVLGVYSAALYDYGGHLPSANGVNMRNAEMAFTSFEFLDVDKNGIPTGKPSGNWMLSNIDQPATNIYKVAIGIANAAVIEASLEELEFVQRVDVSAETLNFLFPSFFNAYYLRYAKSFNHLQDVEVLCKQVHPTNPKWSIIVLAKAPFEGLWSGKITVKRTARKAVNAVLDGTLAHSGKKSLKITSTQTPPERIFRQEMFQLEEGKTYWINAWVAVDNNTSPLIPKLADDLGIELTFLNKQQQPISTVSFQPVGTIIEGWQQIKGTFVSPIKNPLIEIKFKPGSTGTAYYDDLRLQPEKGNMKAYVYDLNDYRLRAILDEENYASFFYYDAEGNLYLTKKETEKGIKTITENVSYQVER